MFGSKKIKELEGQLELITSNPTVKIALEQARLAQEKQKQYDALVGMDLNYTIIRDLINSAAHGVTISVTFKSGEKMVIERETSAPAAQNPYRSLEF